jgi:hypothetical protein
MSMLYLGDFFFRVPIAIVIIDESIASKLFLGLSLVRRDDSYSVCPCMSDTEKQREGLSIAERISEM